MIIERIEDNVMMIEVVVIEITEIIGISIEMIEIGVGIEDQEVEIEMIEEIGKEEIILEKEIERD